MTTTPGRHPHPAGQPGRPYRDEQLPHADRGQYPPDAA